MAYHKVKKHRERAPWAVLGRLHIGHPRHPTPVHYWTGVVGLSPHVFAYKYRGRESRKGGGQQREKEKNREGEKEKKQGRKRKKMGGNREKEDRRKTEIETREMRGGKKGEDTRIGVSARKKKKLTELPPGFPATATSSTVSSRRSASPPPPPPPSSASSFSIIHVACEQWRDPLFNRPATPAQPKMVGPGPVQFWKKKGKQILLEKTYNFSAYFSIKFCLILVCIFTP